MFRAQETLTPVHMEFLRVCLKVKVYHIAAQLLDHSAIYDIAVSTGSGNRSLAEGLEVEYARGILLGWSEHNHIRIEVSMVLASYQLTW